MIVVTSIFAVVLMAVVPPYHTIIKVNERAFPLDNAIIHSTGTSQHPLPTFYV